MGLLLLWPGSVAATWSSWALGVAGSEVGLATGDCELSVAERQLVREERTAAGTLVRDLIATKRTFHFAYSWLPGKQANVPGHGMGRDDLRALYTAGGELSFHLPREGNTVEDVTVMFGAESWSERLVQSGGAYGWVWALAFDLVEV